MFRKAEGHWEDTKEHRDKMLEAIRTDTNPKHDIYGNTFYHLDTKDGQVWVEVNDETNEIRNGGINKKEHVKNGH